MRAVSLLLAASVLSACALTVEDRQQQARAAERRDASLRDFVAKIRVDDGIDEDKAQQIAKLYFQRFSTSPGTVSRIVDEGSHWEVSIVELNTGSATQPIRVDKASGGVTWALGPTTRTIQDLLAK